MSENLKPNPDPTPQAVARAITLLVHDGYRDEADLLQALLQRNDALLDALDRLFQDMAAISMAGLAAKDSKDSTPDRTAAAVHDEFPDAKDERATRASKATMPPDYYESYLQAEKRLDAERRLRRATEAELEEARRQAARAMQLADRWREAYKFHVVGDSIPEYLRSAKCATVANSQWPSNEDER